MSPERTLSTPRLLKADSLDSDEQRVLDACEFETVAFDEVVERTGLTTSLVSSILSALEVKGMIQSSAGYSYVKISPSPR